HFRSFFVPKNPVHPVNPVKIRFFLRFLCIFAAIPLFDSVPFGPLRSAPSAVKTPLFASFASVKIPISQKILSMIRGSGVVTPVAGLGGGRRFYLVLDWIGWGVAQ